MARQAEKNPGADKGQPIITGEDFAYAIELVWWCSTRFGRFVSDTIGDADERNPIARVRKYLRKVLSSGRKDGWCKERELLKNLSLPRKTVNEILNDLAGNGEIKRRQMLNANNVPVAYVRLVRE